MRGVAPHTTPVGARPPSLGAICAASWRVGAGSLVLCGPSGSRRLGRGGGSRSGSSVGRGGGPTPPAPGGGGRGPRGLRAGGGGGGGRSRRGLPAPLLGGGLRYSILAPLASSAHPPPACGCGRGRGANPGWGGVRGGPWTAPPGAPADLNPPSALPEWAVVTGGSCGERPPYCSGARVAPARWCGLAVRPRPPREQVRPHPPPPASRSLLGGGGGASPRLRGGRGRLLWLPSWGGVRGGGVGGATPPLPPPSGVGLPSVVPGVPPRGILAPWGLPGCRGRRARSGRPPTGHCGGGGGGEGGGSPPPWFAPPSSPGRPLIRPLRLRHPGRRRSAIGWQQAGRVGACLGPGAPAARVQRPLWGGCGAAVSSVCLRPLLGLSGRGVGEWGGPSGPLAPPPDGRGGGRHCGPGPGGQPSAGGSHPSPAPLYLEPDPRAGPRWGPSSPQPLSRGAGRPGAAVRVSGQRLAGCGAAGSPPCSLSPPSLPREVARAPASRRTMGGAWVGGPSSPPRILAFAVWAITCVAACVGAEAVAAASCAGGSASGRGRCARPRGASCWRPHP